MERMSSLGKPLTFFIVSRLTVKKAGGLTAALAEYE
jgi:hypothetical protein